MAYETEDIMKIIQEELDEEKRKEEILEDNLVKSYYEKIAANTEKSLEYLVDLAIENKEKSKNTMCKSNDKEEIKDIEFGKNFSEYEDKLKKYGFDQLAITTIKDSSKQILEQLTLNNKKKIKGAVIGNVQSGKTANMSALMSLAADNGFNLFIMLSGTKNTLKDQTMIRFRNDLPDSFKPIGTNDQLVTDKPNYLIIIKNPKPLKDLKKMLDKIGDSANVIIFDDESDNASMDTNKEDKEATAINEALVDIIENSPCKSMNFIGYTATPYANLFGYNGPKDLFPSDFIKILPYPNIYFGCEQIFGSPNKDDEKAEFKGLDIIRKIDEIDPKEWDKFSRIEQGSTANLWGDRGARGLREAICYFYCAVGALNVWKSKGIKVLKHASMMIHSSHITDTHFNIVNYLKESIENLDLNMLKEVWKKETKRFGIKEFKDSFKGYGLDVVNDYPSWNEIKPYLKNMKVAKLNENRTSFGIDYSGNAMNLIALNSNGENDFKYDNTTDNIVPYIVVGGNILSRGLTLEGLVCSYFLRNTNTADTLMQMGRWFGYRKGYELLPRIYMDQNGYEKFQEITALDVELRDKIIEISSENKSPEYLKLTLSRPEIVKITASNKNKTSQEVSYSYSGARAESKEILQSSIKSNLDLTFKFLDSLNKGEKGSKDHNQNNIFWHVDYKKVLSYLKEFSTESEIVANTISWYEKESSKSNSKTWSVILGSVENGKDWETPHNGAIKMVKRAPHYKLANKEKVVFASSVLGFARDFISDINDRDLHKEITASFNFNKVNELRKDAGISDNPILVIYIVDPESENENSGKKLSAKYPVAIISIRIPNSIGVESDKKKVIAIKGEVTKR